MTNGKEAEHDQPFPQPEEWKQPFPKDFEEYLEQWYQHHLLDIPLEQRRTFLPPDLREKLHAFLEHGWETYILPAYSILGDDLDLWNDTNGTKK